MSEKKICVVGCSGFVGSHVTAQLLERGYDVRGTLRDPNGAKAQWLRSEIGEPPRLELVAAELGDPASLAAALSGCDGVISCAGTETQEPETIDLMVGGARAILAAAEEEGMAAAVFTSSTGSTNPPGGDPEVKNEVDHWSDPDAQQAAGKFSPAAKTLMDREIVARNDAGGLRACTFNPSMITGPAFSPEPTGGMRFVAAVLSGERMKDGAPNGSMSFIDVRDLAALHIAALENETARGRYFGVKRSWHWVEVLQTLEQVCHERGIAYAAPPPPEGELARPTTFDLSRQKSLGVEVRDLPAMFHGVLDELERRGMLP